MLIKTIVLLIVLKYSSCQNQSFNWDLAVVFKDKIQVFQSNKTSYSIKNNKFQNLKALTYDNFKEKFIVSNEFKKIDTIYSVNPVTNDDPAPLIQNLPDDVMGLIVDPINNTVFWTDTYNRTINYASLIDLNRHNLFEFTVDVPFGLAIDVCNRYIFWTNANINNPAIEKANLDGTKREILVNKDLKRPTGITFDFDLNTIYWADVNGMYYKIESLDLDSKKRKIIYKNTYGHPSNLAVDKFYIYWVDTVNKSVYKINKKAIEIRQEIQSNGEPKHIITNYMNITRLEDCSVHKHSDKIESRPKEYNLTRVTCLNNGKPNINENSCLCPRGYSGNSCENYICTNFCFNGECYLNNFGYPQCYCKPHYSGYRCESNICENFCFNDGLCNFPIKNSTNPLCECKQGFSGNRCEIKNHFENVCRMQCDNKVNDILPSNEYNFICNCSEDSFSTFKTNMFFEKEESLMKKLSDPIFLVLFIWGLLSPIIIITILIYICCNNRRKRPVIRKRIIVNKNVQPLTYRPQQTEQCEITIENCCNMNVCETPCFEPPKLRSAQKNEDKKKLLSNMENSEDFY